MDELVMVMKDILAELQSMNEKLDEIRGDGLYNSLAEIHEKLCEIQGNGTYNSLSDICSKLEDVERSVDAVDTTIYTVH